MKRQHLTKIERVQFVKMLDKVFTFISAKKEKGIHGIVNSELLTTDITSVHDMYRKYMIQGTIINIEIFIPPNKEIIREGDML